MLTTATTWGITTAQFLTGYGLLCVAAAAVVWWQYSQAIGSKERGSDPPPELGTYELALIGGGPQLAITSALARLHGDKLVRIRRNEGTLKVEGELEPAADPVERAVFQAVRREPGIAIEAMRREVEDSDALASLSVRLDQAGLLLDGEQAAKVRRLLIVGALLAALGIARVAAGLGGDVTIGWTAATALAVAIATLWLLRQRPLATNRGREVLRRLRGEREELRRHPGAGESALAVALFGGGTLWLADPATAAALGVPREDESGGGWRGSNRPGGCGGGGGSSGSGGGGGCGGGGCGGGGG